MPLRKVKLLLVEGDAALRETASSVLRRKYGEDSVTTAETLAEALVLPLDEFDLVLTEWVLPDKRGHDVLGALREAGADGVVVVTEANVAAAAVEAIFGGACDYAVRHRDFLVTLPVTVEKSLAFCKMRRERDTLHRQLREQNETLGQLLRSLEEAASTDPLTNLFNRRHFATLLERMYDDASRAGADLSCVMIDMDGFKQLNDSRGHQAGDQALVVAANQIRDNLRKMDAAARYGGDEFVVLLPRTDALEAAGVARRIRESYRREMEARGFGSSQLGISFGVATLAADRAVSGDALVALADSALYRAKRLGRDRVHVSSLLLTTETAGQAV